uniref:Uncharacterized protein n=1 Tax=Arion vulgaris TaxID=1028688 RepID=A0A0B6ZWU4_9EUPU
MTPYVTVKYFSQGHFNGYKNPQQQTGGEYFYHKSIISQMFFSLAIFINVSKHFNQQQFHCFNAVQTCSNVYDKFVLK